ncbi:hypothetical protein Hdeb2414_s0188g00827121 [Helianthus debilis subsp. tardiflorus]
MNRSFTSGIDLQPKIFLIFSCFSPIQVSIMCRTSGEGFSSGTKRRRGASTRSHGAA